MTRWTGLGSLPGTDFADAMAMVLARTDGYAFVPELPARGPWAGMLGRGLGLLDDLPAQFEAGEWRLGDAAGVDQRRARSTWRDDLERLEEVAHDYDGTLKVAVVGPWTLAASVGIAHRGRVLADPGARRDLGQALAHAVAGLLADLHRKLPSASLVLQVDEPSMPSVLAGAVPTPGGFFRMRAVGAPEVMASLAGMTEAARAGGATTVMHSCAPGLPLDILARRDRDGAGFDALALDGDLQSRRDWESLGQAVDDGTNLLLGVQPTAPGSAVLTPDQLTRRTLAWLRPLELGPVMAERLTLTPACGLAGFSRTDAAAILANLGRAAAVVTEELSA
ncbi:MAG TPA: methionine synthase [Propionibacteriaceae bacterium]|nr:methionine synthase [Propionibacteriaceae bacterium]HBY23787.1 methionine synthase [Propionibacteriaceae bacterium]